MIGSDPKYQAIINAYKAGQLATTAPQYNPIYDIRSEQIAAGELPAGSQFPIPQLVTTPTTEPTTETFDPCPPGYQLVDGVCQPDTMFQEDRGGNDKEIYTGPKITDGIIEGYKELEPTQQMMGTFYQSLSPEMKAEYEKAASYKRGIQFKTDPQGNVIRIVAKSPTGSQWLGDIAGGFGNLIGSVGDAAINYLGSGGLLGMLKDAFFPAPPTIKTGGSVSSSVTESPLFDQTVVPTGINRPGYSLPEPKIEITFPSQEDKKPTPTPTPKKGTGESGPPGRNYSTARSRAAKAASKLGTTLATRGR